MFQLANLPRIRAAGLISALLYWPRHGRIVRVWRYAPATCELGPDQIATRTTSLRLIPRMASVAVIVLPTCFLYFHLVRPIASPEVDLPNPNGYDELLAVAPELELSTITPQRRAELFNRVRRSLAMPARVNVNYSHARTTVPYQIASCHRARAHCRWRCAAAGRQRRGGTSLIMWTRSLWQIERSAAARPWTPFLRP